MFSSEASSIVAPYFYRSILAIGLAAGLATGIIFLSSTAMAELKNIDCDDLIGEARKINFVPKVVIDPNWGIVRIITPEQYCREPIEEWNRRGLSWPVEMTPDAEAPQSLLNFQKAISSAKETKKPAPVEPKPAPVEPKPAPLEPKPAPIEEKPEPPEPKPAPPEPKPEPIKPKTVLDPPIIAPIEPSAPMAPAVVTSEEATIDPYGLGSKPPSVISEQMVMPQSIETGEAKTMVPNLAGIVSSKMRSEEEIAEEIAKEKEANKNSTQSDNGFLSPIVWMGLSIVGLGLGGGVAFFFYRRKSKVSKKDGTDEDEDDDDDDEEEGSDE